MANKGALFFALPFNMLRPIISQASNQFLNSRFQILTSNTKFLFDLTKRDSRVSKPNTEQNPGAISKREQAYSISLLKSAEVSILILH